MKKKKTSSGIALPYFNRRIRYEHILLQSLEVGVVLTGLEVRSLLKGNFDITKSFVDFSLLKLKPQEIFWENALINDSTRKRKLLLNRREIKHWFLLRAQKKAIIVVQRIYLKNHRVKLEIVLAKRKKKYEHREKISRKIDLEEINKIKNSHP